MDDNEEDTPTANPTPQTRGGRVRKEKIGFIDRGVFEPAEESDFRGVVSDVKRSIAGDLDTKIEKRQAKVIAKREIKE